MKPSFFDLTYDDLKNLLIEKGFSPFGATQIFDWVYKKWVHQPEEWSNVSKAAKEFFKENYDSREPNCRATGRIGQADPVLPPRAQFSLR